MKNFRMMFGLLLSLSIVVSCGESTEISNFVDLSENNESGERLIIEASQETRKEETRTTLQTDGSVYWNPADEISLFFISGENGGNKFTSQNKETTAIAQFSGVLNGITGGGEGLGDDAYFWAIYPYSEENSCDGESITTTLPHKQQAVEETFADDLFITIARSQNVKMGFRNVCGGIKFCVSQTGIKSVTFRGNNDEPLAGKVRVAFDESDKPEVREVLDGATEVTVTAPNEGEFEPGKFYYMILLPTALEYGFTMTFNKSDNTCVVYNRTSAVTVKRSIFLVARNLDTGEAVSKDEAAVTGGSESGFYLGIIGFNQNLYSYPICHLTEESSNGFYSFIDGLYTNEGTLLYYAVENSIDALQEATYPDNLYDVAIVTFTDGLDIGSLDANDYYLTNSEYLETLNTRLTGETVSGKDISAYSIGVRGDDVTNYTSFQNNLKKLATSNNNVFEVTNMTEVNEKFAEIADMLGETKYVQKFMFEISSPSNGERCRFTFDGPSSATSSKQYIEGTFIRPDSNRTLRTLTNLTYVGLTSTTESLAIGIKNDSNNKYVYTFEGIQSLDGELVSVDNVQHWYTSEGVWALNSEFLFDPGTVGLQKIKRSAAILLNLDCSSSLGSDFTTLQQSAKSFVAKLLENAVNPNEVASISLNKSALSLYAGNTATLTATVLPKTALLQDVEWSSTNTSVASVNQSGVVTAHKPGTATIIAKTVDGGYTAACYVSVIQLAEEIALSSSELSIYTGKTATLTATVTPENTTNKQVTWSSSKTAVATIDSSGVITPVSAGTTTITATTKDGSGKKATCIVTVLQHVESISLNYSSIDLEVNDTIVLKASIYPSNSSNKNILWETSNKEFVTIDQNGLCTAVQVGEAIITAYSEDGEHCARCSVKVSPIDYELRKIYYTTTNGKVVDITSTDGFGANILSNTYQNGQGIILFDNKITTIPSEAFEGRYKDDTLKSIIIPNAVTSIGSSAFCYCETLTNIVLSDNLTQIGSSAFEGCDGLTSFIIPEGVTSLKSHTFSYCSNLKSLTIPKSVESIEYYACSNSTNLTKIYCKASTPPTAIYYSSDWLAFAYYGVTGRKIYVPYSEDHSILNNYKSTRGWSLYSDEIVEYEFTD